MGGGLGVGGGNYKKTLTVSFHSFNTGDDR